MIAPLLSSLPLLLRMAVASAASALLGLAFAALLPFALRRWPALAAHRSTWLSAQLVLLLSFLLALAPLPRAALAPALTLPAPVIVGPLPAPSQKRAKPAAAGPAQAVAIDAPATDAPFAPATLAADALPWLAAAWLLVYLGGLLSAVLRGWRGARRWRAMLRGQVRRLDRREAWPGCTPRQVEDIAQAGLAPCTTELPLSPMLLGALRPRLLLPAHLAQCEPEQGALIVEHELTHWRRRDPLWLGLSTCIAALLWFNRPCRRLHLGLREAVELGCDDAVLAGRPASERRSYAAALVGQLRLQQLASSAPAFGQLGVTTRVARMREARPPRLSLRARCTLVGTPLLLAIGAASLQPALSIAAQQPAMPPAVAATDASPVAIASASGWRYPLRDIHVTALYGVRSAYTQNGHAGVDFAARRGTPVLAVAAGTVIETGTDPAWGNYIRTEHGAGQQSVVMHLDRIDVARGQRIAAGQPIGAAGSTGRATGPHLHLGYWQDGRQRDPGLMLPELDRRATARALARRTAQRLADNK